MKQSKPGRPRPPYTRSASTSGRSPESGGVSPPPRPPARPQSARRCGPPRRSGIEGDVSLQDRVVEEEGHPHRDLQPLPMRVAEVEGGMVDVAIGDRAVLAPA